LPNPADAPFKSAFAASEIGSSGILVVMLSELDISPLVNVWRFLDLLGMTVAEPIDPIAAHSHSAASYGD
jgi:hypothetical protein